MESETNKNKGLSKEETKGLLSLIEGSKIINNKKTNTTSNKMKVEEWSRIADIFNASMGICRRTPQQLRLKWENLKKNSRKRSTAIRMARIKTGGGPPEYFLPDEILDRVAALLGSTGEGLSVEFGGDAEPQSFGDSDTDGKTFAVPVLADTSPVPMLLIDSPLPVDNPPSMSADCLSYNIVTTTPTGNKMPINDTGNGLFKPGNTTTLNNKRHFKSSGGKRKLLKPDDGCLARNMAMAKYFDSKSKVLETQNENIKLVNQKIILDQRSRRRFGTHQRINAIIYQ
ncbi:uncharacterized protein LOC113226028 [Hyposmocoma kahamanoa]|uniref:uncharacterized protein LOC113226028 n=1 Tax=Hyposmocoma kahamanoa TaxID=1477025 RepID=UPI000E6D6173|nr:uncharacterized protein LOC113226028 [Hyposmocoma kahamanoa]